MKIFVLIRTAFLLVCSNTFMTFAWYSHLRNWSDKKWYIAALLSWGIALFEYLIQVPANRTGYTTMSLAQLKVMQEVITLLSFFRSPCSTCISRSGSIFSGRVCVCSERSFSCFVPNKRRNLQA